MLNLILGIIIGILLSIVSIITKKKEDTIKNVFKDNRAKIISKKDIIEEIINE